jgi:tRNA pseudouridine65 synthase
MLLKILYRDEHLIAIAKPSGWLVHRSDIDRHEKRIVMQALRDQLGGQHVHPVHRLDKGTSGVLLLAFSPAVTRLLSQQFEQGTVCKTYHAIVRGWPAESGTIDHALVRDHDDYGRTITNKEAQTALTQFRRLATAELAVTVDRYPSSRYALVELTPHSGRRHQLRRHMKHIAHPIIGDATHGKGRHNRLFQELFGCHRLLLACTRLQLVHPITGVEISISASIGDQFANVVAALGWTEFAQQLLADDARALLYPCVDTQQ